MQHFSRHWKRFILNLTFIPTTFTLMVRSNMCSHSCPKRARLTEVWQHICTQWPLPPPPIIQSHLNSMWVKPLAQGHNDRLRCSGIWTANHLGCPFGQWTTYPPSESQSSTVFNTPLVTSLICTVHWLCASVIVFNSFFQMDLKDQAQGEEGKRGLPHL